MNYNFDEIIQREGTNSLKFDGRVRYFGTNDLLPLWVADMDFRTPDFIVNAIKKRADHEIYGYSIKSEGFDNSVVQWMSRRFNWTIQPEWIFFTPGVVSALNFAVLAFTDPGDKVIVQPPVYFPFYTAVKEHQREPVYNQLKYLDGEYVMDLDHLESLIDEKTKLLILCNPHNPVGRVWKQEELESLGTICLKHNLIILSDEIHSDLILKGNKHIPLASISKELADITVTSMAPSKTFNVAGLASSIAIISNTGLQVKFKHLPNSLHLSSGNLFGVTAFEAAYANGENWLCQLLDYLDYNFNFLQSYVSEHIREIKVVRLEGTYLAWLDCANLKKRVNNLTDFFVKEAKVGFSKGSDFGPGGDDFMRINIGCQTSVIKEALLRVKNATDRI